MGKNGGAAAPVVPAVPISCQVKCGGCSRVLNVPAGIFDFQCPKCKLAQALPPMLRQQAQQGGARGIDASKIQLPCANCRAILNVPPGLTRFVCPQCRVELAVDPSKLQNYMTSLAQLNYMNAQNPGILSSSGNASSIADDAIARIPHFTGLAGFQEEVNEVALEVEQEEDEGGTSGDTFTDYRPSKIMLGPPHPDAIVETASLSAVQPPEPKYVPKIADEKNNALSCLQLETIVYASQRHDHHLSDGSRSGFFLGDGAGVGKGRTIAGLIWENWHHGRRKSLWLSVGSDLKYDARRDLDDVGAKEVEVHALNKYSYAKLDSKSIGLKEGVIFLTYSSLIASADSGRTRLHQLVQWFGGQYDGLIVFDECHKAKNLIPEAGGQATRTGEAVLELQNRLPQARVVYCSATGASEPRNMGYMARLGLWGTGTDFPNFQAFLGALEKRGVGALELVAMDMKARGMYVCRTLSFKGAEFDISEVPLEPPMEEMYLHAVRVWSELRVHLLAAMDAVPEKKSRPSQSQLWRLYWASHQRFFRHMCMAAKVPAAVSLARQALEEGKCVVIGLQSTGEARTEEVITKQGVELDDFISGPRELLLKLVDEHFPLPEEPRYKPSGDEFSRTELSEKRAASSSLHGKGKRIKVGPPENATDEVTDEDDDDETESDIEHGESDDDGRICGVCQREDVTAEGPETIQCFQCGMGFHTVCLMPCPMEPLSDNWVCSNCEEKNTEFHQVHKELWRRYDEAKERKRLVLEVIKGMGLPNNPLDDIIDQLGGPDAVAEMSGRRGMLVRATKGKGVVYQVRNTKEVSMEMININEKQQFMDEKKLVAVISEAASAGVSLQADRRARNQRRRVHITLELPWSADRAIQQFGRTHRSNQTSAPQYRLLFTTLGGEKRFASIVAKRLETLGALTQGDRRSAGPSLSAFNYDSPYGKKALTVMYKAIMEQTVCPTTPPECTGPDTEDARKFYQDMREALLTVGIIRDAVYPPGGKSNKHFGRILETDMHDVGRFLNRALGLPPERQNRLFEFFVTIFDYLVHNARKVGQFDSGIVDIQANRVALHEQPRTFYVDPLSGAPTTLFVLEIDRGLTWKIASQTLNDNLGEGHSLVNGFYQSIRQCLGRYHHLLAIERPGSRAGVRIFRPQSGEAPREMPLAEFNSKYRKITSVESAEAGWMGDYEITANQCMHGPKCKVGVACTVGKRIQIMHIIGGLILPVWGTVEKALATQAKAIHQRLRVVRVETSTNKQRIVGLHIPNAAVPTVRQGLDALQIPQD